MRGYFLNLERKSRSVHHLRVKRIDIIKRQGGFFHTDFNGKVKAFKHGEGYGVFVFFEDSPIDSDFGELVWTPSAEELRRMADLMDKTDHLTFEMLGHGWEGKRPYHKLQEFM